MRKNKKNIRNQKLKNKPQHYSNEDDYLDQFIKDETKEFYKKSQKENE